MLLRCRFLAPTGATDCSHGWSNLPASRTRQAGAEPVVSLHAQTSRPGWGEGTPRKSLPSSQDSPRPSGNAPTAIQLICVHRRSFAVQISSVVMLMDDPACVGNEVPPRPVPARTHSSDDLTGALMTVAAITANGYNYTIPAGEQVQHVHILGGHRNEEPI